MKHFILVVLLILSLLLPNRAWAQSNLSYHSTTDLGTLHHPVSTDNAEAQKFFDRGLTFVYAFNHEEAVRSFQRAADLDPQLAMAYWGMALALGPNINLDIDPERERAAFDAIQQALTRANEPQTTQRERDYIAALAKRYAIHPQADLKQLAVDYKNAMAALSERYPDDLDAATLYAESAMDLHPWQLWSLDGKPAPGTLEIVSVLESVLQRDPNHIGANHYYIHAVEASPHPERALDSAKRLGTLTSSAGHLVHMPSHIYLLTGDYTSAIRANEAAIAADRNYMEKTEAEGIYPLLYYNHNLDFLAIASSMAGEYTKAKAAADEFSANAIAVAKEVPTAEGYGGTFLLVRVRFQDWDSILRSTKPKADLPITNAFWHFARSMARVGTGNLALAEKEREAFTEAERAIPDKAAIGANDAHRVLQIAAYILDAKLAQVRQDNRSAINLLQKAAVLEDSLLYNEPPDWYIPSRELLGGAYLASGDYIGAERAFRADLAKHPGNGRSLFGLHASLKAQGKEDAAQHVQVAFERAWRDADIKLE